MPRTECEITTHEIQAKIRTEELVEECVEILNENPTALTDTKGVMSCLYNRLESYNMYANVSLDVMQGVIPSFLVIFFEYCISIRIATEQDLIRRLRDFDYGALFADKKPSLLGLKKPHLGQNASQLYCLILHLPFIFYDMKQKLCKIWPLLETLLQLIRIIMSIKITEADLKRLEALIKSYLEGLLKFKDKLIPKEHFLTHYPNAIRKVGPLKHTWTMRFESKHKFFTETARLTHNFINIALANKHQKYICTKIFSIQNNITKSKNPY